MPNVFNLYNKYIYINGRWERLNDPPGSTSGSTSVLNFVESMTASDFLAMDLNDLNVDDVYNVTDQFTTDSRFLEGPGIVAPGGTSVAVIQQGTNKYFNILGSTFNIDYIQNEINNILTILDSLNQNWPNISNKPFEYVGEGLDVNSNNELNASQLVQDVTALQAAIANLRLTWSNISDKPFSQVGTSMKVENDRLEIGDIDWSSILNKPFELLSNQFLVNSSDELEIDFVEWSKIRNKPFDTYYNGDFYVETRSNQRVLRIDGSYQNYEFYTEDLIVLRNIINS